MLDGLLKPQTFLLRHTTKTLAELVLVSELLCVIAIVGLSRSCSISNKARRESGKQLDVISVVVTPRALTIM